MPAIGILSGAFNPSDPTGTIDNVATCAVNWTSNPGEIFYASHIRRVEDRMDVIVTTN
jgi:hypothetical protein